MELYQQIALVVVLYCVAWAAAEYVRNVIVEGRKRRERALAASIARHPAGRALS